MKKTFLILAIIVGTMMVSCEQKEEDNRNIGVKGNDVPTERICVYEYVDLGLSVKWATCNVGADSPEDYGNYYAWGETCTKDSYEDDNCSTYDVQLENISGNPEYDVARLYWGGTWRMPTEGEIRELKKDCDWTWTTRNGVKGYDVTGPNGGSIFLPAAGFSLSSSLCRAGNCGIYWSSSPYGRDYNSAYALYTGRWLRFVSGYYRDYGRSIRPVME